MRFRQCKTLSALASIFLVLCVGGGGGGVGKNVVRAASDKPGVSHTLFDNLPSRIVYFDDSTSLMYHDSVTKVVWRSEDEGRTWKVIEDVPRGDAFSVIEHPFDNRVAFILSKGTTHYRTLNRGQTWQSFKVESPPVAGTASLTFHARPNRWDWIMYTGQQCESLGGWKGKVCYDETFVTQDAFQTAPRKLLDHTSRCIWAHSTKEFASSVPEQTIYCIAFEPPSEDSESQSMKDRLLSGLFSGMRTLRESRLYSSADFFQKDRSFVDLGIGKEARGLVGIGGVQGYIVTALKPPSVFSGPEDSRNGDGGDGTGSDEMVLYITTDGIQWSRAQFPHGHGLKENAYTIVESTPYSILVDVLTSPAASYGTLFTSNSNGTLFVRSLEHTNRNTAGIVDYEKLISVEGIAIVNQVGNWEELEEGDGRGSRGDKGSGAEKKLKTRITFDDGRHWKYLKAPDRDHKGKKVACDTDDLQKCSLHLHSVTQPHNFGRVFSSTAPGLVMGVGSVGEFLKPYEESDTFLSTDAGLTWTMVEDGAHKYEFGDQGSILVINDDEEPTDELRYSFDFGKTWHKFDFGVKVRARLLTTIPDSTSQKFLLLGTLTKKDKGESGERHIVVHIDFAALEKRKCSQDRGDFEKWYARTLGGTPDCLMGHKQWFMRRKPDADCVVAEKFTDPVGKEEDCPCSDEDFECDYNFVPDGDDCILAGPEAIPRGQCLKDGDRFMGSSGFRKIPGNTCDASRGIEKDHPKEKDCSAGQATPGTISHQRFDFPSLIVDYAYFADSHTILAFANDNTVWQSNNEGYTWRQLLEGQKVLAMTMHAYNGERAYLITSGRTIHYTTDKGISWLQFDAPLEANGLGIPLLDFHPTRADWLIWTGSRDCSDALNSNCRAIAYWTKDNGRNWREIDSYVRTCSWARDTKFRVDERIIFCESYRDKQGSQRSFTTGNPLQLIAGGDYYANKQKLFENVVGFATFEEYMVVAEMVESTGTLNLMISMNGRDFAPGQFPPGMRLENQAYTVLESVTDSVFLHVTTHGTRGSEWGSLFKSNSNGTYYGLSLEHANRNEKGFVDFEKMIGLDGIAVMNIVSNPDDASVTGKKLLQTRITFNDGGRWKPLIPPRKDSLGRSYDCLGTSCALHVHGYTERIDPRATYSSPSAVGLMIAVGNVGENLAPYVDSDTFLTRDGGFTWEEIHKDAHIWEYGDQGSIIVLANDEGPTDRVSYSLNEGKTWQDYVFGDMVRVRSIVTVPTDTSRKFILLGYETSRQGRSVAIHLDFSQITNVKCTLDLSNPNGDDFELWSPSEEREEQCLFGRQTLYHRRIRDRNCYIGEQIQQPHKVQRNCPCGEQDFECEFNHRRNSRGECVLVDGAQPLASDMTCSAGQEFWFERTNMRKIPYSTCSGGLQLDKGQRHVCPGSAKHSWFFWASVIVSPFLFSGLAAFWWKRRRSSSRTGWGGGGYSTGRIRLGGGGGGGGGAGGAVNGALETLASVPWFIVGIGGVVWEWASNLRIPFVSERLAARRSGYRALALDDDAALLNDYEDE